MSRWLGSVNGRTDSADRGYGMNIAIAHDLNRFIALI